VYFTMNEGLERAFPKLATVFGSPASWNTSPARGFRGAVEHLLLPHRGIAHWDVPSGTIAAAHLQGADSLGLACGSFVCRTASFASTRGVSASRSIFLRDGSRVVIGESRLTSRDGAVQHSRTS
jgi:hypothetical protein